MTVINKKNIHDTFYKSRFEYGDNAYIQKQMAQKLSVLIKKHCGTFHNTILEMGCGTGILTEQIYPACIFQNFFAFDIVGEYKNMLENAYPKIQFCAFDLDEVSQFKPNMSFNLIISNAAVQWSSDTNKLIRTCMTRLAPNGTLALAFFGEKNFLEIKKIFGVGLHYLNNKNLAMLQHDYDCIYLEEKTEKLNFESPLDILRHIKKTGVGGMTHTPIAKSQLRQYETEFGNSLTYHCLYLILKNSR